MLARTSRCATRVEAGGTRESLRRRLAARRLSSHASRRRRERLRARAPAQGRRRVSPLWTGSRVAPAPRRAARSRASCAGARRPRARRARRARARRRQRRRPRAASTRTKVERTCGAGKKQLRRRSAPRVDARARARAAPRASRSRGCPAARAGAAATSRWIITDQPASASRRSRRRRSSGVETDVRQVRDDPHAAPRSRTPARRGRASSASACTSSTLAGQPALARAARARGPRRSRPS